MTAQVKNACTVDAACSGRTNVISILVEGARIRYLSRGT
jgi:hypothetical protein